MNPRQRAALFLDRDGTVIVDVGYPKNPDQVQLVKGVGPALRTLQTQFALVLVSNQSGIGRGLITADEAQRVHERTVACLAGEGVSLDEACYCPHPPEAGCACRKPSPDMLLRAAKKLDLDLTRSFMVGDRATDIEAGCRAGCRSILFKPISHDQSTCPDADLIAYNWSDIVQYIFDASALPTVSETNVPIVHPSRLLSDSSRKNRTASA